MTYRLLDLFCGAGGAAMGYHRAGFEVVGVDIKPQPHYPFEFHQADALDYCREHGREFDGIHASPPCQGYMTLGALNEARHGTRVSHPLLVEDTRSVLLSSRKPFVVENVQGAPLETQIILCGFSMGLAPLARHRHFESNVMLFAPPCSHRGRGIVGIYGRLQSRWIKKRVDGSISTRTVSTIDEARRLMGIDWMDWEELREAIPPAYTEFIGKQLMQYLRREAIP